MELANELVIQKTGYNLHLIKTDKYKTNTIIWKMKAPLKKETATIRALLPYVLQNSTKLYPTTSELRSYLDSLYGATFYTDLSKKGENHIITFTLELANEAYLNDPTPLLQEGLSFLQEVLIKPNVENGAFVSQQVEKEKRNLKQRIEAVYDDKMRYASVRLVEEMCKDEPYELQPTGELDQVDNINGSTLYEYYQQTLREDQLDLYIIGDIDAEIVEQYCSGLTFDNEAKPVFQEIEEKDVQQVKKIHEFQELNQGKLNLGCRTYITYGDKDYFVLQMFNGIFGGFPHSKLFLNVREKASLAYYAASRIESHKGLLMIMAGIDNEKYDEAVRIIEEQLGLMKKGEFTDEEIGQTKAVIENQFLETIDSARGLIEVLYHNVISQTNVSLNDWIDKVKVVTKEDIIRIAQKIKLDTIYFLSGKEGEQNEKN